MKPCYVILGHYDFIFLCGMHLDQASQIITDFSTTIHNMYDVEEYLRSRDIPNPAISLLCWLMNYEILKFNNAFDFIKNLKRINEKFAKEYALNIIWQRSLPEIEFEAFNSELNEILQGWNNHPSLVDINPKDFEESAKKIVIMCCSRFNIMFRKGFLTAYLNIYSTLYPIGYIVENIHLQLTDALTYYLFIEIVRLVNVITMDDNSLSTSVIKFAQQKNINSIANSQQVTNITYSLLFDQFNRFNAVNFVRLWSQIIIRPNISKQYLTELINAVILTEPNVDELLAWSSKYGTERTFNCSQSIEGRVALKMKKQAKTTRRIALLSMFALGAAAVIRNVYFSEE